MTSTEMKEKVSHFLHDNKDYLAGLGLIFFGALMAIALTGWWFTNQVEQLRTDHREEIQRLSEAYTKRLETRSEAASKIAGDAVTVAKQAVAASAKVADAAAQTADTAAKVSDAPTTTTSHTPRKIR